MNITPEGGSMYQLLFKEYGNGQSGLKIEDLVNYYPIITDSGMNVPPGYIIKTGVFDEFMKVNCLDEDADFNGIESLDCTETLRDINSLIWEMMPTGSVYAVRSSALSERGGVGIYTTVFFVKSGNREQDLALLWEKERQVYASEFTDDARQWRMKQQKPIGMALLIQKVPGKTLGEDEFAPSFGGTAYTCSNGTPMVRIVAGLGASAVKGTGQLFTKPPAAIDINFKEITVIKSNGYVATVGNYLDEEYDVLPSAAAYVVKELFAKMQKLQEEGSYYLEWAYTHDKDGQHLWIVQCAPHRDKTLEPLPAVDTEGMELLTETSDIVGHGVAVCEHLVTVKLWCKDAVDALHSLINRFYKDYLLVIPSQAICATASIMPACGYLLPDSMTDEMMPADLSLKYSYYSNAGAILEWQKKRDEFLYQMMPDQYRYQPDHTDGMGGTHFQGVCDRTDILFAGSDFDGTIFASLTPYEEIGNFVKVYKVQTKVIVDGSQKKGSVYIGKQQKVQITKSYSPRQINSWSMTLRYAAGSLGQQISDDTDPTSPEVEVMNSFYIVHYAMDPESGIEFNPFAVEPSILEDEGVDKVIGCIETVILEGSKHIDAHAWNSGFSEYLEEYRDYLVASKQQ